MRTAWAAALMGAGAIVIAPASAHACSYGIGPDLVVPAGASHPSNAAVVLVGSLMSPDALTATIDDVAVALVIDDALATRHISDSAGVTSLYRVLAVRLEPQPRPGQQVRIGGHACGEQPCPDLDLTYTASEPDLEIASVAPTLSFDVARYSGTGGDSCVTWGSLLLAHSSIDTDAFQDEALVLYEVTARHRETGLEGTTRDVLAWLEFGPRVLFDEYGDAVPLDGWCVDVGVLDAAGNAGPVTRTCDACGVYDGEPVSSAEEIPFVPVIGGPCDLDDASSDGGPIDGGESSDGDTTAAEDPDTNTGDPPTDDGTGAAAAPNGDVEGRGCSCGVEPTDPSFTAAAFAAVVLVGARSRRRRSPVASPRAPSQPVRAADRLHHLRR